MYNIIKALVSVATSTAKLTGLTYFMAKFYFIVGYVDHIKPDEIIHADPKDIKMYYEGGEITSRSAGSETLEELKRKQKITENPCVSCGGVVSANYSNGQDIINKNLCFHCNFWDEKIEDQKNPNVFIIDGTFYTDAGRSTRDKSCLGFGGAEFRIETFDGRIIETNNLWCASKVSRHYIDKFPDNARFCNV